MAAESGDRGWDPWPHINIAPWILTTHGQKQARISGVFRKEQMNLRIKRKENIFRELSLATNLQQPLCYHLPRRRFYRICNQKVWQGKTRSNGIKQHNTIHTAPVLKYLKKRGK